MNFLQKKIIGGIILGISLLLWPAIAKAERPFFSIINETISVLQGSELILNVSATDPDGDPLELYVDTSVIGEFPDGSVFVDHGDGTGTFTWTPMTPGQFWMIMGVKDDPQGPELPASDERDVVIGVEEAPPFVVTTTPRNGQIVPPSTLIFAEMSEAIDATTVNDTTVQLFDSNNNPVAVFIALDLPTRIAIVPLDPLAEGSYTAIITTGVTDLDGNSLEENYSWTFTVVPAFFNIDASVGSGGSISPPGSSQVAFGENLLYTITPDTGYNIFDVTVDGSSVGSVPTYTFENVTADHAIGATFQLIATPPVVVTTSPPSGGIIPQSGIVYAEFNEQIDTASISPLTVLLELGGSPVAIDPVYNEFNQQIIFSPFDPPFAVGEYTATITTGVTDLLGNPLSTNYSWTFSVVPDFYDIISTAGAGGSISPSAQVAFGDDQTFIITPNPGYVISALTVDSLPVPTSTSYTFTNVTANHTIDVTFEQRVLSSISITPPDPVIIVGETQPFTATTLDQFGDPIDAAVTWDSSDELVGTIDTNGLFTSTATGTSQITVTANGVLSANTTITVNPVPPVLTSIIISSPTSTIKVGQNLQFTATGFDQYGNQIELAPPMAWGSSSTTVATIDSSGSAIGQGIGNTTITFISGLITTSTEITVLAAPELFSITITPDSSPITSTYQLSAWALDQYGDSITTTLTWESSNTSTVEVDQNGLLTATGLGTATITASSGLVSDTSTVIVEPYLTSLIITSATSSIYTSSTIQLHTSSTDQFGNAMSPVLSWISDSPTLATVDQSGLARGVSPGIVNVTASSGSVSSTVQVEILALSLVSMSVTPTSASILTGQTQGFSIIALDQNGNPFPTEITWSSSNPGVATVTSTGLATGVSPGTVTITASSSTMLATSTLTVNPPPSGGGGGGGGGGGLGYQAPLPSEVTAVNVPLVINQFQEGELIMNFAGGTVFQMEVENGAVSGTTTFQVTLGTPSPNQSPTSSAFLVGGQVFNITATGANTTSFHEDLEITLTIPGVPADPTNLAVYFFNTATNQWELVPSMYDPALHKFTFEVDHLTMFAVFQVPGKPAVLKTSSTGLVLGEKVFDDGTLLRSIKTKKVYLIFEGKKILVSTANLKKFSGKKIINEEESIIASIPTSGIVLVNYANGTVLRTPNKRIYVVQNWLPRHIKSLEEFKNKYKGKTIIQVDNNFFRIIALNKSKKGN